MCLHAQRTPIKTELIISSSLGFVFVNKQMFSLKNKKQMLSLLSAASHCFFRGFNFLHRRRMTTLNKNNGNARTWESGKSGSAYTHHSNRCEPGRASMETTSECIENSSMEICSYSRCSYLLLIDKQTGLEYNLNRVNIRILPGMPMYTHAGSRLDELHPSPDILMLVLQGHSGPFQMGAVSVPSANAGTSGNLTVCQRDVLRWHLWPIKKTCRAARLKLQADACCNWPQPASVYTNTEIKARAFDTWGQTLDMSGASRQAKKKCSKQGYTRVASQCNTQKARDKLSHYEFAPSRTLPLVALEGNAPGVRSLEVGL